MKRILIALSLVLLIGIIVVVQLLQMPPLSIEESNGRSIVHVETLGEYPTTVTRIEIKSMQTGQVVLLIERHSGIPQLRNFLLMAGENSIKFVDPEHGTYDIAVPKDSNSFVLNRGETYRIRLWGTSRIPSTIKYVPR